MFEIESYIKDFSSVEKPAAKKQWVSTYEEMIIHTRGVRPDKLIKTRRPYEDKEIQKYRLEIYEPITKRDINNAINDLQRIFNGSNVKISMNQDLKNYISQSIFNKVNFSTYINKFVTRRMIEDPNGLLVWWVESENDEILSEAPQLANKKVDVEPILVLSRNIIHYTEDILTFIADEKSDVTIPYKDGRRVVKEGKVYYMITRDFYYIYRQVGKKEDDRFELIPYYKHDIGEIPAIVLGGYETSTVNEKTNEETCYFSSFFSAYVAFANEAIRQFSDHQAIMVTAGHPIREMEEVPCTNRMCKGGTITTIDENNRAIDKQCEVCNGKGHLIPTSTYGVLIKPKGNSLKDLEGRSIDRPALRYISPDVAIVKYAGEHWMNLLEMGKDALNQLFIQEAQSGKAKEIDRENKLASLDTIGINIYESIMKYSLLTIAKLRNIAEPNLSINLPVSFRIKTELELIQEQTDLKSKGAPGVLVAEVARELLKKRFNGDEVLNKIADVLPIYDPYFIYTVDEKSNMEAGGVIDYMTYQRSLNAHRVLQMLAYKDKQKFLEMDITTMIIEADKILVQLVPPEPTLVTPSGQPNG